MTTGPRRFATTAAVRAMSRNDDDEKNDTGVFGRTSRRDALVGVVLASVVFGDDGSSARAEEGEEARVGGSSSKDLPVAVGLTKYVDKSKYFELRYPSSWNVASKPGAEVLFKNPESKYSNIGVTVSPVTINSLTAFGSLSEIGEKLALAESKKESTVPGGVSVQSQRERVGAKSGATFYDYEYRLITTYGNKRIYTSVSITDSTLYILNAQVYETADPENPTEAQKSTDEANMELYRQIGSTFDVSKRIFD